VRGFVCVCFEFARRCGGAEWRTRRGRECVGPTGAAASISKPGNKGGYALLNLVVVRTVQV
jgi:hypothetical protein